MQDVVQTRRDRLKKWIDDHYNGVQSNFVNDVGINQGELSGLLRGPKSFGEKKARSLEQSAKMPPMWLDGVDELPPQLSQIVVYTDPDELD